MESHFPLNYHDFNRSPFIFGLLPGNQFNPRKQIKSDKLKPNIQAEDNPNRKIDFIVCFLTRSPLINTNFVTRPHLGHLYDMYCTVIVMMASMSYKSPLYKSGKQQHY